MRRVLNNSSSLRCSDEPLLIGPKSWRGNCSSLRTGIAGWPLKVGSPYSVLIPSKRIPQYTSTLSADNSVVGMYKRRLSYTGSCEISLLPELNSASSRAVMLIGVQERPVDEERSPIRCNSCRIASGDTIETSWGAHRVPALTLRAKVGGGLTDTVSREVH